MLIWGKQKQKTKKNPTMVYKPDLDHQWPEVSRPLLRFPQEKQCNSATPSVATQGSWKPLRRQLIAFKGSHLCTQSWELEPITILPWGYSLKITIICLMHLIYILPEEPGPEHKTTVTRKVKPLKSPHEGKWTSHKDTVLTAPRRCLLWRVCSHWGTKCSLFLFSGWC